MITIGPGKLDSEVVTFKFTADMSGKAVDPTKVRRTAHRISLDRNSSIYRLGHIPAGGHRDPF